MNSTIPESKKSEIEQEFDEFELKLNYVSDLLDRLESKVSMVTIPVPVSAPLVQSKNPSRQTGHAIRLNNINESFGYKITRFEDIINRIDL